ncbi:MBL fold metallo-hydrolase [Nocardioides aequoreus]|uniref:MBL fold metallo-hydrolase n=1 Tax=Nocardioides aequoreus TaxID=397278 RepID=UPI0004C46B01|nr:MBL fold metallo-hydrolase [Nocardioides aequoreus]
MLTEIADGVLVHRSELLRNNTVVVTGDEGVLLVDAGITGAEMTCLADDLRRLGRPVAAGFATHPDWDHVLWHPALGEAPRYGTARCAEVVREVRSHPDWRAREAAGLPEEIAEETPLDLYGLLDPLPGGTTHLPWDGPPVRVVEHPAHSPGHAALVVEESGVLVAGDMLSDVFVPMLDVFADGNDPVAEYLQGLAVLETAAQDVDVAVPGHGSVARDAEVHARIQRDRAYLHALLDGSDPDDPRLTSPEPGWEWVAAIHEGQARSVAARRD